MLIHLLQIYWRADADIQNHIHVVVQEGQGEEWQVSRSLLGCMAGGVIQERASACIARLFGLSSMAVVARRRESCHLEKGVNGWGSAASLSFTITRTMAYALVGNEDRNCLDLLVYTAG